MSRPYCGCGPHLCARRASRSTVPEQQLFEVVLRFSAAATPHFRERCWHPTQTIDLTPDGGGIFRVRVSEPLEMQPWIRSWGAQVEVLSPDWLRERVADELRRASDRYWSALPDEAGTVIELTDPAGDLRGSPSRPSPSD